MMPFAANVVDSVKHFLWSTGVLDPCQIFSTFKIVEKLLLATYYFACFMRAELRLKI